MTLIELGIVIGIVSVLMALVFGLSRHVDATVKMRRAQAELGEWHGALDQWFLQFGEYPHARIDTDSNQINPLTPTETVDWNFTDLRRAPLTVLTNETSGCYVRFYTTDHPNGTNITFRSFLSTSVSVIDPWGIPYVYIPSPNAKSYTLFSCGPNRRSADVPNSSVPPDTTLDDVYLER